MYKYPLKSLSQPSLSLLTESTYNTSSRVTLGFFLPPSLFCRPSTKSGEVKDRMGRAILDYTLVPLGLVTMVAYHIWLIYRIMKHPTKTVVGINAINRRFWVRAMMEVLYMCIYPYSFLIFLVISFFIIFSGWSEYWPSGFTCNGAGRVQEWSSRSADTEKQYNGIHRLGINSHHAQLPYCRSHDKRQRGQISQEFCDWGQEWVRAVYQVLLNTGVLPGGILAECAVNQVLQPCKYPHQRALQEDVPYSSSPASQHRVCGEVREQG